MSFWARKRVLVTGASGFLGRHLLDAIPASADIYAFRGRRKVDLLDYDATQYHFNQIKPHIVIHAAATVGGIGANRAAPYRFFSENIRMGSAVLDACRAVRAETVVMIGTTCSYPSETEVPFRERDIWSGYPEETNAPYGIAKRSIMAAAQALERQHGIRVVNIVPTNLYGPGDHSDHETSHVIPALMKKVWNAALEGTEVVLWGSGQATRDFLYAADAARGIVHLTENAKSSDPINLGSNREITIEDLAYLIAETGGFQRPVINFDSSKPDGQRRRLLSIVKAVDLGWKPLVPLELGLRATWDAMRSEVVR